MIRRLSFSNFCSFLEETEVDFIASAKTPKSDSFVSARNGDQVSLLTGVFGPNAAGKTNLLKALAFVNFFIRNSYLYLEPKESIPLDRYECAQEDGTPAKFELEFSGKAGRYLYAVALTSDLVVAETLKRYNPKTSKFRTVLSRKVTKSGGLQLGAADDFTDKATLRKLLLDRPNTSMISAGLQTGRKEFRELIECLGLVATNVTRQGKKEQPFEGLTTDIFRCSEFFAKHPEHLGALRELLVSADVGIIDLEIESIKLQPKEGESRDSFLAFFKHQGCKGEFQLSALRESSGTRRLFMLFETLIRVLTKGGIVIVDEMESDLHPHLIPTIFSLFTNPEINLHKSQLFFTCHHYEMLNHLQKEQIILVEKNDQSVSEAYRLDELKGVRREENYFANYNSGRYGAVPEPEVVAF